MDFFVILDHRNDGAAEFRGDDDRLDVAVILESIADHQPVRRILRNRHDGEQFRLGADLEPKAEFPAVAVDFFDHQPLLIDLDREHGGIAVLVVIFRDRGAEGVSQMAKAVRQNIREANDHGRVQIARLESLHHLIEVYFSARLLVRTDDHMAFGVDGKVALAPRFDLVQVQRLADLPGVWGANRLGGRVHVARTITNWCCM